MAISDRFLNVLVTFPNHFFINKDQPKKKHPAHLLPPFCFTHEKKVAWQKEDIPKHLHQTKGHRATHGWCFLFHQKHIIFCRNPSSSRGMWKNNAFFFFGRYILIGWGVSSEKNLVQRKKTRWSTHEHEWNESNSDHMK